MTTKTKIIFKNNLALFCQVALALYLSLAFATVTFAQPTEQIAIEINLPAQSLGQSITQLATQTGVLIGVDASLVANKQAPKLNGRYTPAEALKNILSGSGLVAVESGPNNYTLEKLQLASNAEPVKLPEVKVMSFMDPDAPGNPSYTRTNATSGTKTDTSIFDTPVTVQVVSKAVMNDQQAIGLGNVLQNISGVSPGWGFGVNGNESIQIRGFNNDSIYRGGVLTPNSNFISLANVQRVEVLKGPAGMLFGRTQPGGLVNVVTKRPLKESYYSVQQQFGSYGTYRTLLDVTGALNQSGTLLYRVNYEHLESGSFRNHLRDDRDFIAPSLTWHITQNTQLDLDFMYQNRKSANDSGIPFDLQQSGIIPGRIPRGFRGNEPTDFNNSNYYEGDATLTHRINEDWKVRGRFSIINSDNATAQTPSSANANLLGDMSRGFIKTADDFKSKFGTIDLTGQFVTGPLKHDVLVGTDYYHSTNTNRFSEFRNSAAGVPTINVFNPVYGFTGFLNDPLGSANKIKNEWVGVYVQDQISLWDKWQLLLGGRFDHAKFETSDDSKQVNEFSPRVALMYRLFSWLGIYGNYANTFNAVNRGTTVSGGLPAPERSNEFEVGFKGEWMDGRLFANLAFFNLTKTNVQTPLPAPFVNRVATTGEQRSRGIELDLRGQLNNYWHLIGTYAYTDTKVIKDSSSFDTALGASDGGNIGNHFANVPRHAGSVWTTYDFSGLGAQGFSAGGGVFLVGKRAGNIDNSFNMPSYERVDMMLRYQRKIGPSNMTLQFNIQNLLDKEYIVSSNGGFSFIHQTLPGAPRTFLGSIHFAM